MDVVAAVLALVAVVLLALLITARRNARSEAATAQARKRSLESELAAARRETSQAQSAAETARREADSAVRRAQNEVDAAMAASAASQAKANDAMAQAGALGDKIDSLERYGVELAAKLAAAQEADAGTKAALEDAHREVESQRATIESLELARSETSGDGRGIDPELLWSLEMTRSERTWRHSVAVDPDGPSPFPDAPDPLKMAVEVEAAAMREEVGAFITVQWDAEVVADPIRRLLVLRIANELLAAASREPQPFLMSARGADEVVIELRSTEDGDAPIHVAPPRFGTDVMAFVSDERGVTVTVR